ncbi:MAG: YceI family protein [Saprospiraceae bacterium]|nr:YceI family protein [Saprospiraceae bacterium]
MKIDEEKSNANPLVKPEIPPGASYLPRIKFTADKDHSSISFKTKHWEIVDIIGWFTDFEIVMHSDSADFSDAVVYAEVSPSSLQMPNLKMQGTAQKEPYLNSELFPHATFKSKQMIKRGNNSYTLNGQLAINGINREIDFDVIFNGYAYPGEKSICGFDVSGKINRNDFNVGIGDKLHSGKKVHSDTIYLSMALRME